jgi:hypothetical protein
MYVISLIPEKNWKPPTFSQQKTNNAQYKNMYIEYRKRDSTYTGLRANQNSKDKLIQPKTSNLLCLNLHFLKVQSCFGIKLKNMSLRYYEAPSPGPQMGLRAAGLEPASLGPKTKYATTCTMPESSGTCKW